ncbi:MAG: C40 family peptidase [Clostridia bacterium]|nr:C40 family peptidase [Clostridia bacterium]
MVVCVPFSPIYSSPDLMSEQVDEMLYGEEAEILEESGGFYKIRSEYGYEGYIIKPNLFEKLHDANHVVITPFADLLFEGKNYFQPPMTLPRGSKVDIGFSKKEDRYGFVVLPSKRIYYMHKNHVAPIGIPERSEDEIRESLVNTAKEYLGVQYRWGGRTPYGIDCSGLMFNAYRFNGITIWRDADFGRNNNLRAIHLEEAKKGDMIFFPGHVAMYIGDGFIIHASASRGKVSIEKLEENVWLRENIKCVGTAF